MAKLKQIGARRLIAMLVGLVGLFGLIVVIMADSPGNFFELEGNSKSDGGCDWDLLTQTPGQHSPPYSLDTGNKCSGVVTNSFNTGKNPPQEFTGGGSKNALDTTSWNWKPSQTGPDKTTLTNAYAAEFRDSSNHELFMFGGELFASNGSALIGLWFLQNTVGPLSDGTFGQQGHKNGDILIENAFSVGGATASETVYVWNTACTGANKSSNPAKTPASTCTDTNIQLKLPTRPGSGTGAGSCLSVDEACAISNATPTIITWDYESKYGGTTNSVPATAFFEGGIDVTEIYNVLPGREPCISSFIMVTQTTGAPSTSASGGVLKRFIGGGFNTCGTLTITKSCDCDGLTQNTTKYEYQVSGTVSTKTTNGLTSAPFDNVVVTDTTAGITCNIGTIPANTDVTWGNGQAQGSCTSTVFTSTTKPGFDNSATATGTRRSDGATITTDAAHGACGDVLNRCPTNPGLLVEKQCKSADLVQVSSNQIGIQVSYLVKVSNTGTTYLTVNVCDQANPATWPSFDTSGSCTPIFTNKSMAPGAFCWVAPDGSCPQTPNDSNPLTYTATTFTPVSGNQGKALFRDVAHGTATGTLGGNPSASDDAKYCELCPAGVCPAAVP